MVTSLKKIKIGAMVIKFYVKWEKPGGMGSPRYEGTKVVYSANIEEAAKNAREYVWKNSFSDYKIANPIKIKSVCTHRN